MILTENKFTNISGTYPNALIIDASGAGLTDGSEYAALQLNDGWIPFSQAVMNYAAGVQLQNVPTGSVGVPNGVADSVGLSQMLEALLKLSGTGPGKGVIWFGDLDPSVTGDRVILLSGQGVLISVYPGLDAANYVGDVNNAAVAAGGGAFYRSSDAAGLTPNVAGPYLQLPDAPGRVLRVLDSSGAVDPDGASRFLGDAQLDSFQGFQVGGDMGGNTYYGVIPTADGQWFTALATPNVARSQFSRAGGAQGAANRILPVADLTNGTPRTDSETRGTNISFHLGITY